MASCSGGETVYPVTGKVIYQNKPLAGATVTFHPKKAVDDFKVNLPVGRTDENGVFTLSTGQQTGAPAGEYVVTIVCMPPPKAKKGVISTGSDDTPDILRNAYSSREHSKIHVTIQPGDNNLKPFELK